MDLLVSLVCRTGTGQLVCLFKVLMHFIATCALIINYMEYVPILFQIDNDVLI